VDTVQLPDVDAAIVVRDLSGILQAVVLVEFCPSLLLEERKYLLEVLIEYAMSDTVPRMLYHADVPTGVDSAAGKIRTRLEIAWAPIMSHRLLKCSKK
jgi:hypothetical protein